MKKYLIFSLLFYSACAASPCAAQFADDLVKIWIKQNGINDKNYSICEPSSVPVVKSDGICFWGPNMGPQPTPDQLRSLVPLWQEEQNLIIKQHQYEDAIGNTVLIKFTNFPYLNGEYKIDNVAKSGIFNELNYFQMFNSFSNGQQTIFWPVVGGVVQFKTIDDARLVYKTIANYVTSWQQYSIGGNAIKPEGSINVP